jgi:hypothetical protein
MTDQMWGAWSASIPAVEDNIFWRGAGNRENGRLEAAGAEAIYRLLQFSAFEPEEITRMTAAYEHALRALRLADRQDPITELVAKKIIEVARLGESDPVRIQIRALEELGVTPQPPSRLHR